MPPKKKITAKLAIDMGNERAQQIDRLLQAFEDLVDHNAGLLTDGLLQGFVSQLDVKDGIILSNEQNMRKIQLIDRAYKEFADTKGMKIATALLSDMEGIMLLNDKYFEGLQGGRKVKGDDIKNVIRQRLGINEDGELIRDGYMMGLLDDPSVREEIKSFAFNRMPGGAGFQDFRKGLKELIEGSGNEMGTFKRFYRNYAFDSYAQVDALNGQMYADKLGLKYFIYNGGILRDKKGKVRSRPFCVHRAGKVFSSEEAAKWKDDKELTAVDNKSTYNWAVQRGGFGCRHSIDYISEELAFEMRPELKDAAERGNTPDQSPADVAPIRQSPAPANKLDPATPFDQVPDLQIKDAADEVEGFGDLVKQQKIKNDQLASIETELSGLFEKQKSFESRSDEWWKVTDEISKLQGQQLEIYQSWKFDYAAKAREYLTADRKASTLTLQNPYTKKAGYEDLNKSVKDGHEFLSKFIGEDVVDGLQIKVKARAGIRAYYSNNEQMIMLDRDTPAATVVHELCHAIEAKNNVVMKRAVDFLEDRAKSLKPVSLKKLTGKNFRADEVIYEDDFFSPYCGKIYKTAKPSDKYYKQYYATEIVSMGVQRLFENPVAFYLEDRDYFNFIFSLFR
jgi:hypothetical protein